MLPDCQPFVHKHNSFSQALSGSSYCEAFAVNINIYLHRAVGILMGGLCSLLQLWNKITWCAALPTNAVPGSYISFLKNNNYLWGSFVATFKEYYLISFNRAVISCCTIQHNIFLMWIPEAATLSVYHCDLYSAACRFWDACSSPVPLNTTQISEIFAVCT